MHISILAYSIRFLFPVYCYGYHYVSHCSSNSIPQLIVVITVQCVLSSMKNTTFLQFTNGLYRKQAKNTPIITEAVNHLSFECKIRVLHLCENSSYNRRSCLHCMKNLILTLCLYFVMKGFMSG